MKVRFTKKALRSMGISELPYRPRTNGDSPTNTVSKEDVVVLLKIAARGVDDVGFCVSVIDRNRWRRAWGGQDRSSRPGLPENTLPEYNTRRVRNPRANREWLNGAYGTSTYRGDEAAMPPVYVEAIATGEWVIGWKRQRRLRKTGKCSIGGKRAIHVVLSTPWSVDEYCDDYRDESTRYLTRAEPGILAYSFLNGAHMPRVLYSLPLAKKLPEEFAFFNCWEDEFVWAAAETFKMADGLRGELEGRKKYPTPLKIQRFAFDRMNDWRESKGFERIDLRAGRVPAHLDPKEIARRRALAEHKDALSEIAGDSRFAGLLDE